MIRPPYLQKGDTVAIVSPAKKILPREIEYAIKFLESNGLKIKLGEHVFGEWNRFSGTDEERTADFQWALNDQNIKAIFCARGGYGSVRIIDQLDFTQFTATPKWIIGYSDITVFHNHINTQLNIATIHGPMPLNIIDQPNELKSANGLIEILYGRNLSTKFQHHKMNVSGQASGALIGGNLSVLCGLIGTNSDIDTENRILFIEDLCEENYKLDRMLFQLEKSGKLSKLNGAIIGSFTQMTDLSQWFQEDSYNLIANRFKSLNIPVAFNFPAGHISLNTPLVLGQKYWLKVSEKESLLKPA